ncbi:unnamed protein product [Ilex paraguariensis]|uniref:RING-type E3 ubiquitin transferase n=1 Tax=Ilex paraguariensis TaxID=185542 RepID=A0ABC8TX67_9AQUA
MAFKFNHRKLIPNFLNDTITQMCTPYYCNPTKNKEGACPFSCIIYCYPTCYQSIISEIEPPEYPLSPLNDHPNKTHKHSLFVIISLSILATVFFLLFCFTIYKFYTGWYRSRRRSEPQEEEIYGDFLNENHGPVVDHPIWFIRTVGLQPSVITAISIVKYKRGEGLVEGTECSVCLNEFQEDETLRLLPKCNHAFHLPCIDTWLRSHTNCPMCRARIVINLAVSPSPEQSDSNLGHVEETQVRIPENNGEFGRHREDEARELRIGAVEEGGIRVENGVNIDGILGKSDHLEVDEVQPMRRSVSMDSLSASMIRLAMANAHPEQSVGFSDSQFIKVHESNSGIVSKRFDVNQSLFRLVCSSSFGRSVQKGPGSMKRSFSCSGKVLSSRYNHSRKPVLPS